MDFDFPPPLLDSRRDCRKPSSPLQLDVRLSLGKDLAHLDNVMLQEVLVQGMSDLQLADECECRDLFFSQLENLVSWP